MKFCKQTAASEFGQGHSSHINSNLTTRHFKFSHVRSLCFCWVDHGFWARTRTRTRIFSCSWTWSPYWIMHFLEVRRSVFSGHFISKCLLWSVVRGQFCTEIDHGLTTGCIDCTRVMTIVYTGTRVPVIFDFFQIRKKKHPCGLEPTTSALLASRSNRWAIRSVSKCA